MRHPVQPEVEVAPERPLLDGRLQVAVGGRHDPHVDGPRARGAQAQHLPFFQHAQQLDLDRQRRLADLVQQHRSAFGRLQQAGLGLGGAREGAPLVPEQLVLEQRLARTRRN